MGDVEKKIIDIVGLDAFEESKKIGEEAVLPVKTLTILGSDKIIKYSVKDNENLFNTQFIIKNEEVISATCSCEKAEKCLHIAKVLMVKSSEFFSKIVSDSTKLNNELYISNDILNRVYNSIKINDKKVLKLEIELHFIKTLYAKNGIVVSFKMGEGKLYSLNNRVMSFFESYLTKKGTVLFGKEFEYNPNIHYFNDVDTKIIDFCSYMGQTSNDIYIPITYVNSFLKLLENKKYTIYPDYECNGVIYDSPYIFDLEKVNDLYRLSMDNASYDYKYLDMDKNLCLHNNKLYSIPKEMRKYIDIMDLEHRDYILFDKDKKNLFYRIFGKYLNKSINIDKKVKNDFELVIPKTNLYFDLDKDIICNIEFMYNDDKVNYFDESKDILRNNSYEDEVIKDIMNYGFNMNIDYYTLDTLDDYESFLEKGLPYLSKKYNVFTTEQFNNVSLVKDFELTSRFSIGADNIFTYSFKIDKDIEKELKNVLENLNSGKKYYRFKNGKILNLDNKKLKDLRDLTNELNIDVSGLESAKEYTIPKFRALYIDSIKSDNSIIETNNKFDEFVSNFKKVKSDIIFEDNILRNYQEIGIKWLYNIYKCGFGGILADEMGLGKSIQIIYFIKEILKENKDFKILIVSPTALIYNWENEFNKFGNKLKYMVVAGNREVRKNLFEKFEDFNIFITTYGLIKEDKEIYLNKNFEVLIIDEAQMIKNPKTDITRTLKNIKSNTKLALTGTPIENALSEIWSIFDFIMPGYLNNLSKFNEKYSISNMDEEDILKLDNLNKQISPFILRRRKSEVLKDLPEKLENNIYLELNDKQKLLYTTNLEQTRKEMDEMIKTEGFLKARFKILSLITKLRQICIDPKIIDDKYSGGSIKMDEVCNAVHKLTLDNHKILIFTSYLKALEILKGKLDELNISNYVIDGSVSSKKRQELVTNFNKDDTKVFLIMLKAGGTGLNLTGADTVIHLDLWWNPQVEAQATDRAHRIGQKKMVEVIKFICKGTIEEKILELQEKKKKLSDTLIESEERGNDLVSNLTEDEFRNLLSMSE